MTGDEYRIRLRGLTRRQRRVLALVTECYTNREIAAQMGISVGTVKHHVHDILLKLEAPSRRHLIARHRRNDDVGDQYSLSPVRYSTSPLAFGLCSISCGLLRPFFTCPIVAAMFYETKSIVQREYGCGGIVFGGEEVCWHSRPSYVPAELRGDPRRDTEDISAGDAAQGVMWPGVLMLRLAAFLQHSCNFLTLRLPDFESSL